MTPFFRAARAALALSMAFVILPAGAARAEGSLLIWSPSKISGNAYRLRMGARTPPGSDARAGVDFSVTTSSTGSVRRTRDNARLWAEMQGRGASGAEGNVAAGYNPATGRATASAGVSHRWMATPSVDILINPSVWADSDMRHGHTGSVRVTQKAQLQSVTTGTSLIASGTAVSGQPHVKTEFRVEQNVMRGLNVAATVQRQDAEMVGAIRARFRMDW
ncbi:hypothetical protein B5M44_24225 [Shinella sumterensis]|uniref:hypothetical protein n=1 Tax=Shinella sumterensis TaxID=1967501 RepID=UPI00106E6482|nr:hypothetical protein [Shinella sumterensis]MCD1267129.1 hypothetical protein [Shinella sumterensis]TFE94054.1 hypothetical protein B5M44_24225 [Shinella sumterensis]